MEIKGINKSRTVTTVSVLDALGNTREEIVNFAVYAASERRESLFGNSISWVDDFAGETPRKVALVSLYTD